MEDGNLVLAKYFEETEVDRSERETRRNITYGEIIYGRAKYII